MWDNIEKCHPEEEVWFDLAFSALFGLSVAERLDLQASNMALGSVINLVFPILYVQK